MMPGIFAGGAARDDTPLLPPSDLTAGGPEFPVFPPALMLATSD